MANYIPFARSNYFAVVDPQAFEAFCAKWRLEMIRGGEKEGDIPLYGFLCDDEEGIPTHAWDPDEEKYVESDFIGELSTQLAGGWVAVVREIGYEKMRYLTGFTIAVNRAGARIDLSLNRIYEDAARLGKHVTECEY